MLEGALVSATGVGVAVTDVGAIDDNVLLELVLLCDDVVEELEALNVVEEELELELELEDVGSFMRTQICPTTFKAAIKKLILDFKWHKTQLTAGISKTT